MFSTTVARASLPAFETALPAPASPASPPRFELNLEALRGFAALVVVLHHVLVNQFSLDPAYTLPVRWAGPLPGHSSVLLFFILSGYVIGRANPQPLTWRTVGPYLRKRLVRLYPIYVVGLLLTLLALEQPQPFSTIAAHFLLLQNAAAPCLFENNPLWSLNYEVLYYLAFIPISALGWRADWVAGACAGLGLLFGTVLPLPLLSAYCFGFVFWASGLWLAQAAPAATYSPPRYWLGGLLLLFLGYEALNPFMVAAQYLVQKFAVHLAEPRAPAIPYSDLLHWPFCFCVFGYFARRPLRGSTPFLAVSILSGYVFFLYTILKHGLFYWQTYYLFPPVLVFSAGAGLLLLARQRPRPTGPAPLPAWLLKLGAMSYALYVIHFPTSILLSHIPVFKGSALTFSVRLALDLLLVLTGSYWLELRWQPWVKARLGAPEPAAQSQ